MARIQPVRSRRKTTKKKLPLLAGKLMEVTKLLDLKWTKTDYSLQRLATCWFCAADIRYVDPYAVGDDKKGNFNIIACNKCAVEAGLIW